MVSWGGGSEGAPTQNKHTSSKERHSCCACGFLWRCVLSLHLQSWLLICAKRPLTSHTSNCPSPTPALRQQSGGTHQLRAVSSTKRWHTSTAGCVVGCWPTPPLYTSNAKRTSGWRCQVSINVGPAQTAALSVSKIQRCILLRGSWMRVPVCACLVSVASHRAPGCVSH